MKLLEAMQRRRSVRNYTEEPVSEESLRQVLQAGLLSASSRGIRPWELIVVRDRQCLEKMAACRTGAANMLTGAKAAVVVIADEEKSDVWIEDCAIVMANMHLMADHLGLGSCWIQGRQRTAADGQSTESYLRTLLGYPAGFRLEAVLSLGIPKMHPDHHRLEELPEDKIHWEQY